MSELPKNWVETTLSEIAEWGSGGTPKRGMSSYYGGDIPWVKTGDLNDELVTEVNEFLTEEGIEKSSAKIFPKGSIALAMYGATIGRTGVLGMDAATNQACAVASPYLDMHKYLYWLLRCEKQAFIDKGKGGAQPNISQTVIKAHKINLPPLGEQKRMVAKLDVLFGELEELKGRLANILELLKNFRQAVLTQAVTGKLTEQWRVGKELGDVENEVLIALEEIISLEKSPTKKKTFEEYKKGISEDSIYDIPETWISSSLKKLCSSFSYGSSSKSLNEGDVPVLRMGNLQNGIIDWDDLKYSSDQKEIDKYRLKNYDVLFNRTNSPELVGKTSIITDDREAIYAGYLIKIAYGNALNPFYLNYYMNSPYARFWCNEVKSDGVSQSNINAQKLSEFNINVPSKEEQEEIVHRVESLFAQATAIETKYEALTEHITKLPQAILAKAFRGELVSQLPTDGDAKELLEEIKALKESLKVVKKKKKKVKKK